MASASVVVTNFNYERYLADAVDSALGQGEAVEVIVVDDGSTDGSVGVIRGYGSRIIPVLRANAGQAAAFNAGFAACTGAVVCFLDADDLLWPGTMTTALTEYEAAPFAKMHWPLQEVDAAGRSLGATADPLARARRERHRHRRVAATPSDHRRPGRRLAVVPMAGGQA